MFYRSPESVPLCPVPTELFEVLNPPYMQDLDQGIYKVTTTDYPELFDRALPHTKELMLTAREATMSPTARVVGFWVIDKEVAPGVSFSTDANTARWHMDVYDPRNTDDVYYDFQALAATTQPTELLVGDLSVPSLPNLELTVSIENAVNDISDEDLVTEYGMDIVTLPSGVASIVPNETLHRAPANKSSEYESRLLVATMFSTR